MRRWIAKTSDAGLGGYWCLYEGAPGARTLVATVCKFVTCWRGYVYVHAEHGLDARRSPSQASAREAAQWLVEQLAAQRGMA